MDDESSPSVPTPSSPAEPEVSASAPARPSTLATVLLGLVAPILTGLVAAILVLFVAACLPGAPRTRGLVTWALRSGPGTAATLLLQNALLVLWAWRLARHREMPVRAWLRLQPARLGALDIVLLLVLAAGVFGLGALVALVGRQLGLPADVRMVERLIDYLRAPGISWLVLVLAMGVGPGIGEEVWVRGHLLRSLETRLRAGWAVAGSAALFALLHLDPAHMLFALPFGLVFGWLAIRTDSILPGILCHAFVNSGVNFIRALEVRKPGYVAELEPGALGATEIWSVVGLIVAGLAAGIWLERRFRSAPPFAQPSTAPPSGVEVP